MKIILRRSARVHDRMMHAGDVLDCEGPEWRLWCLLNWAELVEEDDDFSDPAKRPNGRKYRRRDMRAEE